MFSSAVKTVHHLAFLVVVASNGELLAFCERTTGSDTDDQDLERHADGGATWGEMQVIWDDGPKPAATRR